MGKRKIIHSPNSDPLAETLESCKHAAREGFQIANSEMRSLLHAMDESQDEIKKCYSKLSNIQLDIGSILTQLQSQLSETSSQFDVISNSIQNDLVNKQNRMGKFSITLFGRTMAGKSTLMEILRHGDGASIGKGSQRTTRDVRTYSWNGLEITDVPGIAAFEGEDDEQIALFAASSADLILFLITDDAPQESEAEFLARIRMLGKPIIGILNVKVCIDPDMIKFSLMDARDSFNQCRLDAIKNQFIAFAKLYGQDWSDIPFIYTHLQAAYMSQLSECSDYSEDLWTMSHFGDIESALIHEIEHRGKMLRIKTFIDAIATPASENFELLANQSLCTHNNMCTMREKKNKLYIWKENFRSQSLRSIDYCCSRITASLLRLVPDFVDDHYQDHKAGKKWSELMRQQNIEKQARDTIDGLFKKWDYELQEIAREIREELNYASIKFSANTSIRMKFLVDKERCARWGLSIGSGVLTIIGIATETLAGPVGWAASALAISAIFIPPLFKKHSKSVAEAKETLRKDLESNIYQSTNSLKSEMNKILEEHLIKQAIESAQKSIRIAGDSLEVLAKTQQTLAFSINTQLKRINMDFIQKALQQIGALDAEYGIKQIARLPGERIVLQLSDDYYISNNIIEQLESLLQEKIFCIHSCDEDTPKTTIGKVMRLWDPSFDWGQITYDNVLNVIHISAANTDPTAYKFRLLAQQLAETMVVD